MKKKLLCAIDRTHSAPGALRYVVFDGLAIVASGFSSTLEWVKLDAGGHHTKKDFDARYPEGWEIEFDFARPPAQGGATVEQADLEIARLLLTRAEADMHAYGVDRAKSRLVAGIQIAMREARAGTDPGKMVEIMFGSVSKMGPTE